MLAGRFGNLIKNPSRILGLPKMILFSLLEHLYAWWDAKCLIGRQDKTLFVDLGANLGQGFGMLSKYFSSQNIDFELFEPNPHCFKKLQEQLNLNPRIKRIHNVGVGAEPGTFKFYGLDESEGGLYSQGGSIVKEHNSDRYNASSSCAIDIEVIDFSDYLRQKERQYQKIVVKMDIEGAEVELLESMLAQGTIELVDLLYVEFHSQYQSKSQVKLTREREEKIIASVNTNTSTKLRIWH